MASLPCTFYVNSGGNLVFGGFGRGIPHAQNASLDMSRLKSFWAILLWLFVPWCSVHGATKSVSVIVTVTGGPGGWTQLWWATADNGVDFDEGNCVNGPATSTVSSQISTSQSITVRARYGSSCHSGVANITGSCNYAYGDLPESGAQIELVIGWDGSAHYLVSCTASEAITSYYASGCVTNNTAFASRYMMNIYGTGGDGNNTIKSEPIAPGDYWCVNVTNQHPFQFEICRLTYNSDGGTNSFNCSPRDWAGTNSVVDIVDSDDGETPNNPSTGGQTNLLTEQGYFKGVSNIINTINNAQLQNNAGFKLISSGQTNGSGSGTNIDYTAWLAAISNRVDKSASNSTYTSNLFYLAGTNYAFLTTNLGGIQSNSMTASNAYAAALATNYFSHAQASTNIAADVADSSIWVVTLRTNASVLGATATIDLDPTKIQILRAFTPWWRLIIMFGVAWAAVVFIKDSIEEASLALYQIPGAGPGRSGLIQLVGGSTLSVVSLFLVVSIFPIIMVLAIQVIVTMIGGSFISPLSEAGISLLSNGFGDYTPHIRAALNVLFFFVPVMFILQVAMYLIAFEIILFGARHFASFFLKSTSN